VRQRAWAGQWRAVRMLGTFLMEEPASVPASVVAFVAGQLGEDAEDFAGYGARQQTLAGSEGIEAGQGDIEAGQGDSA